MKIKVGTNLWFYPYPWVHHARGNITFHWLGYYVEATW